MGDSDGTDGVGSETGELAASDEAKDGISEEVGGGVESLIGSG